MRSIAKALLGSILSFAYWLLVLVLFYGAVAGDRSSTFPEKTGFETYALPVTIVAVGILIYAGLLLLGARIRSART